MSEKYHISIRGLHWLMAIIILSLIALGIYMVEIPKEDQGRFFYYNLHKSFGVMILMLLGLRVLARIAKGAPALPGGLSKLEKLASKFVHCALYVFMLAAPLSGYAMSNSFGYDVQFFGITMPRLFGEDKELGGIIREAHGLLAYAILALVSFHVLGVIKHRFFDAKENDVLKRMT